MEDLARTAMEHALKLGAEYADLRLERSKSDGFLLENGAVEIIASSSEVGAGVRVLAKGAWGFYAVTSLEKKHLLNAVKRAYQMAVASSQRIEEPCKLAETRVTVARDAVRVKIKMDDFPMEERIKLAKDCDSVMEGVSDRIHRRAVSISGDVTSKLFSSTEGALIQHDMMKCYLAFRVVAHKGDITEDQSKLEGGTGGFEATKKMDPLELSEDLAKKVCELVNAPTAPTEEMTVLMDPDYVSLLTHEIIGHPSEADRVLGREAAWAGVSWWKGMLGQKIGSDILNASDDSRVEGALGYYMYDDEGVPAKEKVLIKNGVLVNHMHSRETATIFGTEPNGGMRAMSCKFAPLIRMSNTFIKPGDWAYEEMIEDIDRGIYAVGQRIPSIDNRRYNWQISCKWAHLIEKGELTQLLRDVTIAGTAPNFFKSIDAVGKDFVMRPLPNCGKGDPIQVLHVGNGGPHIRGKARVIGTRGK
ncbi:MAG: TldD/PmbA family protein [Candidatus Bathyarchaeota archaeon]|jgi:TldD protein